jgi:hypothetical protein
LILTNLVPEKTVRNQNEWKWTSLKVMSGVFLMYPSRSLINTGLRMVETKNPSTVIKSNYDDDDDDDSPMYF